MVAFALGCTSRGGAPSPDEAGRDGRAGVDARTDGRREAGPADARPKDATSRDAASRDASSRDAAHGDTGPTGTDSGDAGARDARPGDGGAHEGGSVDGAKADADAHPPTVTAISISPLPLTPSFSKATYDYYLHCAAGTNTLAVSMTAAPGSTIALKQPIVTAPATAWTGTVGVDENQAIVAQVTTGSATEAYWIRCLPADFPKFKMTLHPDAGAPAAGYYLIGDVNPATGESGYAMVIDGNGVPVWYGSTDASWGAVDVDSVVPGTISFVPAFPDSFDPDAGQFQILDLSAKTKTYLETSGVPLDVHDLRYLADGDYLVLAQPILTGVDLTGLSTFGANEDMIDCVIQELTPSGIVAWQWDAMDHFDPVQDCTYPGTVQINGATVVEPFHCNSLDVASNGDVLVSARHMDSVFLVSKATGDVLWKMGGAAYNKDSAPFIGVVNDPQTSFYRQHDARLMPGNYLSLYDNETGMAGPARGVVYTYDLDAGTATPVWIYKAFASAAAMGSVRFQANGACVIGWGGEASPYAFSEIDEKGNKLLDFSFTDGDVTYRAIKVATSAFDLDVLRATAGTN
jgi:hypothetical protein